MKKYAPNHTGILIVASFFCVSFVPCIHHTYIYICISPWLRTFGSSGWVETLKLGTWKLSPKRPKYTNIGCLALLC